MLYVTKYHDGHPYSYAVDVYIDTGGNRHDFVRQHLVPRRMGLKAFTPHDAREKQELQRIINQYDGHEIVYEGAS